MRNYLVTIALKSLFSISLAVALITATAAGSSPALAVTTESKTFPPSNEQLAQSLQGGFVSSSKNVNGVNIHYVIGGKGKPLLLLPGWPQTWWEFHKLMPELAKTHQVIAVDIRGMGESGKPSDGYDKKTMAADIHALVNSLGFDKVDIAGHDIGAMVAYSFAANYPDQTRKIALIDVAHPDESLYSLTLLPPAGQPAVGSGKATHPVYLWWFALNQIPDLPEEIFAGRMRILIDWLFDTQLRDRSTISSKDREIYAAAYSSPDAIRAGNAWYQAFRRDIEDQKAYGAITTPILVLAGERNYPYLKEVMPAKGRSVSVLRIDGSSHYVPEDEPEATTKALKEFFK